MNQSTFFIHSLLLPVIVLQFRVDLPLPLRQMESLFGSLPEMLDFQRVFLQTLEERIASSPDFSTLETPAQFKVRQFALPLFEG